MAGVTPPTTFSGVQGAWTDGVSQVVNGFASVHTAISGADLTLTTSGQDIPGCSVTFTVSGTNGIVLLIGTIGWAVSVAAAGNLLGDLFLDGSATGLQEILDSSATTFGFRSITQHWVVTGLSAGSHTYKLQAHKDAAGATAKAVGGSKLSAIVFDVP